MLSVSQKTTIVLADDHQLVRESIASLLSDVPNFAVVSQCQNGRQLVEIVDRVHPNVAVIDISMAELNGIDAARQIRKRSPGTRIIALSVHTDEAYINEMIDAGISGYVVKCGAAKDLVEAIRCGSRGRVYFSPELSETAEKIRTQNGRTKAMAPKPDDPQLTPREREVLQLIGEGWSGVEIANKLNIGETTVKTYRNKLMDKLNVRDIAGLTRQSIKLKLVHVE
jgi:two-component system, NarL family, response regulator NreC